MTMRTGDRLAIHGGQPVRAHKKPANPVFSEEAKQQVRAVLDRGALTRFYGGDEARRFEAEFAAHFGRRHAVACNSGTAALHLMYAAARLPAYSEVLVPANAYVSAVSALLQADLIPVLVDIDRETWSMDPEDCERKLTPRTRMSPARSGRPTAP